MLKVIGIGDNVVDRYLHKGIYYPGGNSLNFAVFARQLGYEAAYMGVLANDAEGRQICYALRALGVDYSHSPIVDGETGRSSTQLVNGDRVIVTGDDEYGAVKANPLVLSPQDLSYISTFDVVHSSCYSFAESQLAKIKATGVPLVYDFSDEWDVETLKAICPDITIAFFSGKKLPEDALREALALCIQEGCALALCTRGRHGALATVDGVHFYSKTPYNPDGTVVDTLGAGDSFLTGFLTTYILGKKQLRSLTADTPCMTEADQADFTDSLLHHSMSVGNALAIRNCMVDGAFGYGKPIVD